MPLAEIARMDDRQLYFVYCRARDEDGTLIRESAEQPRRNGQPARTYPGRCSWERMYRQVWAERGLTDEQVEARWQDYLLANPSLVDYLERLAGARRRR